MASYKSVLIINLNQMENKILSPFKCSPGVLLPVILKTVSTSVTRNTWWFSSTWKKDLFIAKPCKGDIKNPCSIRDLTHLFLQRLLDAGLMRCNFWPRTFLLRLDCFSCCHQVHSALLLHHLSLPKWLQHCSQELCPTWTETTLASPLLTPD